MASSTTSNGTREVTYVDAKLLYIAMSAILTIGGVTFKLVLDRMDKQETIAAAQIAALREEIKSTKSDAKDAVSAAALASKDAVAATALALKDAVTATSASSKDAVTATASALKDAVTANALSSKESVTATATSLSEKIDELRARLENIEAALLTEAIRKKMNTE